MYFANILRIKRNTLFPAARFCCQQSDKAVKSGGGQLLRYPPPKNAATAIYSPYKRPSSS